MFADYTGPLQGGNQVVITGTDLKAFNTFEAPQKVSPQKLDAPSTSGNATTFQLPPRSYSVIQWEA